MALALKQQLQNGKYTVERELGRGRFGITYLARDKNGDGVAIKTLNDAVLPNQPDFDRWQQNFVNEAFKLSQCQHPHIVRAEKPFLENGLWCIAMEYVQGIDLSKRAQIRMPEDEALRYIQQIGEALIVVHDQKLIHRDIKPDNIVVRGGKPEAVLIDFGLALDFDHDLTQTREDELAKGFAAPELYLRSGKRGAFTDIYSLAATLYVLLTGTVPASAKERKFANARLVPPKKINPQISDRTNRAIIAGMEIETKSRPQTMREWLDLLGLTSVNPHLVTQPAPKSRKLDPIIIWTAVTAVATVLGAIAALMGVFKPSLPSSPDATQTIPVQLKTSPSKQ
jgi:serine/threonine protein kinase